jgi:hypothetical protein
MVNSHTEKVLGSSPSLINRLKSIFFLESFCFCEKFRVDGFLVCSASFLVGWGVLKREKIGVG